MNRNKTDITLQVSREEVTVMFYDKNGWKAPATVILVHKQVAIVIETPPYRDGATSDHVNVSTRSSGRCWMQDKCLHHLHVFI